MKFCSQDMSQTSTFRFTKISKVLIILVVCLLPFQDLFSQHTSRDNHIGFWEDSLTWDPLWSNPEKFVSGYDITINGYVTVVGSLGFYGFPTNLAVNDTLVIKGNLYLHNNNDLIISDQGVLIIRGNLWIEEHSLITTNGYLIITGDIYKDNNRHFGSFKSNDNPPKAFIGGSVYPPEISDNFPDYPVLNCSSPVTTPYPNSGCSSGNMADLENDSIYPFFLSTCNLYVPQTLISVCPGDSIHLMADGGLDYSWKGPSEFNSDIRNPSLADADSSMSGIYTVHIMSSYDCEATDTISVIVNTLPDVSITSSDDILCLNEQRFLTGIPAGGKFTLEKGHALLIDSLLNATEAGEVLIKYLYTGVCSNTDSQAIIVNPRIAVSISSNDDTLCLNDQRTLTGVPAGGTFTIDKGGILTDNILTATQPGEILVKYLYDKVCSNTDSQTIIVDIPVTVSILSSDDTICVNDQRSLVGLPAGGKFTIESGPGEVVDNILKAKDAGEISIKYLYNKVCSNSPSQIIVSSHTPQADAGASQPLDFHFETRMTGSLDPTEEGTWSLLSGTGQIADIHSPETKVTGLSMGENVFLWTVSNGGCESEARVTLTVLDPVIPSVFTPNGDGINELFEIGDRSELYEITVFNQWGIVEYQSNSLVDGWDGRNNNGEVLPPETYFYVLKFENGHTKKGTVLIVR
jgi:gliding motility-associated-like protein